MDEQIERALNRLRAKVDGIPESAQKRSFLDVLDVLEAHYRELA